MELVLHTCKNHPLIAMKKYMLMSDTVPREDTSISLHVCIYRQTSGRVKV